MCSFAQFSLAFTIFGVRRGFFLGRYAFKPLSRSLLFTVRRLIMVPSSARLLEILLHVVLLSLRAIFLIFRSCRGVVFLFLPHFPTLPFCKESPLSNFFLIELMLWGDTLNFRAISFCFISECCSKTFIWPIFRGLKSLDLPILESGQQPYEFRKNLHLQLIIIQSETNVKHNK